MTQRPSRCATAGAGGTIGGTSPQTIAYGASGTAVTAVPNTGYHFVNWSDGIATAARTDTNVTGNIAVTANFAIDTNVAPTVAPITVNPVVVEINKPVSVSATFADADTGGTHTAIWDWDDGATSPVTVTETNGSGSVSSTHTYSSAGVYTVMLTVTDDDGGLGESVFRYVVVYDPNDGFVSGAGLIESPPGAYTQDPSLAGKANFGFVAKYQSGANVPTGQTQFRFQMATLHFSSGSYEWLVVAGARAQYKGNGDGQRRGRVRLHAQRG